MRNAISLPLFILLGAVPPAHVIIGGAPAGEDPPAIVRSAALASRGDSSAALQSETCSLLSTSMPRK